MASRQLCSRFGPLLARQGNVPVPASRTFFTRSPFGLITDMSRQVEQMERSFNQIEREMNAAFRDLWGSSSAFPSLLKRAPVAEGRLVEDGNKYVLKLDLGPTFDPENVKVTIKDKVLTIDTKFDHKSEDGTTRMYQEVSRSFTLPEGVKMEEVKSLFTPEGELVIEAPLPEGAKEALKPKEIPIAIEK